MPNKIFVQNNSIQVFFLSPPNNLIICQTNQNVDNIKLICLIISKKYSSGVSHICNEQAVVSFQAIVKESFKLDI